MPNGLRRQGASQRGLGRRRSILFLLSVLWRWDRAPPRQADEGLQPCSLAGRAPSPVQPRCGLVAYQASPSIVAPDSLDVSDLAAAQARRCIEPHDVDDIGARVAQCPAGTLGHCPSAMGASQPHPGVGACQVSPATYAPVSLDVAGADAAQAEHRIEDSASTITDASVPQRPAGTPDLPLIGCGHAAPDAGRVSQSPRPRTAPTELQLQRASTAHVLSSCIARPGAPDAAWATASSGLPAWSSAPARAHSARPSGPQLEIATQVSSPDTAAPTAAGVCHVSQCGRSGGTHKPMEVRSATFADLREKWPRRDPKELCQQFKRSKLPPASAHPRTVFKYVSPTGIVDRYNNSSEARIPRMPDACPGSLGLGLGLGLL